MLGCSITVLNLNGFIAIMVNFGHNNNYSKHTSNKTSNKKYSQIVLQASIFRKYVTIYKNRVLGPPVMWGERGVFHTTQIPGTYYTKGPLRDVYPRHQVPLGAAALSKGQHGEV